MEHESVLVLESGPDRRLETLAVWATVAGIAAFVISPTGLILKMFGCLWCLLIYFCVRLQSLIAGPGRLLLFPDGRARWQNPGYHWHQGVLAARAWSSGCYAVVTVLSGCRPQRFLISRSNQKAGSYRILMAWLRLKSRHLHRARCNENKTGSG